MASLEQRVLRSAAARRLDICAAERLHHARVSATTGGERGVDGPEPGAAIRGLPSEPAATRAHVVFIKQLRGAGVSGTSAACLAQRGATRAEAGSGTYHAL